MNERNLNVTPADSDRWEPLLSEFFAQEVPESLRDLEALPATAVFSVGRRNRSQSRAAALVAAAAAVVLMTVALGTPPGPQRPTGVHSPRVETVAAESNARNAISSPAEPAQESWLVEHFETPEGRVEYRERVRWTEVSVVEPETGAEKDLLLPELDIEVFPLEEPSASRDGRP